MLATVKPWGNSYAIRLTKSDLQRLGIKAGQQVQITIEPLQAKTVDLSWVPTFSSGMTLEEARRGYADTRVARWRNAR